MDKNITEIRSYLETYMIDN